LACFPVRRATAPHRSSRCPTRGGGRRTFRQGARARRTRIRIAGIDAPELDHPWGKKSKFALIGLCKGKVVNAVISDQVSYDRIVARCYLPDGTDLAAELVRQGLALDWPTFSGGAYRHLEPDGIRRKLWRAAARQQGRFKGP